jgi:hypothetical protein
MDESINKPNEGEGNAIAQRLRKTRSDSNWNGLTFEQCQAVEHWLFEENQGYAATAERVKKDFGVETSLWSVARFYRRRARVRQSLELVEAQVASDELCAMPARTEDLRAATIKLVAKSAVRLATEKPEELERLLPVARVLLQGELNEIRLRRVKMEERCHDFEANTMCAKELPRVRAYLQAVGNNENLNAEEKHQRASALLFGTDKVNVQEAAAAKSGEYQDAPEDMGSEPREEGW